MPLKDLLEKYKRQLKSDTVLANVVGVGAQKLSFDSQFRESASQSVRDRNLHSAYDYRNGEILDLTPAFLSNQDELKPFKDIYRRLREHNLMTTVTSDVQKRYEGILPGQAMVHIGATMEDIVESVGIEPLRLNVQESKVSILSDSSTILKTTYITPSYVKVKLTLTEEFIFFEQRSSTVPKHTEQADIVENDNRNYDYLTVGKGRIRRRTDTEAQTNYILKKSRFTSTTAKKHARKPAFVSYYEMYDTYKALEEEKHSLYLSLDQTEVLTMCVRSKEEQTRIIMKMPNFKEANMLMNRLLASNQHEMGLRRYRGMELPSRLDKEHELKYKIEILFEFPQPGNLRRSMADIDFCPSNGDIFAVAYGIFSFSASTVPKSGQVCIWSVKNPENPERIYNYPLPCTAVKFSQFLPSLIAIGLYDGNVEVRDITFPDMPPVSVSNPETLSGCESIVTLRWIKKDETDGSDGIDPFLSLAQDGCVTKFRIVSGPYLISYAQMILERVEGKVEGIQIREPRDAVQFSSQSPQGLNLTVHPTAADIYYIMTDEGCVYKCSTSYAHQYLDVIRAHRSAVNMLDFSPWSPKVYLTCGNDWCIRVWVEGIYKPLITLKDQFTPLNCAYWSRTHSTIIIAINRKTVDIWDISRNLLKPISSTNLQNSFQTTAKIAKCGHSIAVGNERGTTMMCQMVGMPYEPHFQYDELEKAIFKAIALHPDLINELRNIGYFGYKNKGQVLPP